MTAELAYRSAAELAGLIRARSVSPVELVQAYLARIDRWSDTLGAYVTVCRERALDEARAAPSRRSATARRSARSTACRSR